MPKKIQRSDVIHATEKYAILDGRTAGEIADRVVQNGKPLKPMLGDLLKAERAGGITFVPADEDDGTDVSSVTDEDLRALFHPSMLQGII